MQRLSGPGSGDFRRVCRGSAEQHDRKGDAWHEKAIISQAARLLHCHRMRRGPLLIALFAISAHAQQWTGYVDGALFATSVNQTGPKTPENKFFSTNWLLAGAERDLGSRSSVMFRGRFSLEPLTILREGYPQLLQYLSPESGGPLLDHQRAHDLIEEVAVGLEWRPLQLYLAPVGEPPLGPEPYAQRASSLDFAEAPFAYDLQESFHVATRVVAAAVTTNAVDIEGGVFHNAISTGRHTTIDDGNIDSWSARLTIAPRSRVSAQISTARLGDEKREVTSASVSYNGAAIAASAIATRRDHLSAYGVESTLRGGRNTLMARLESVDRPAGVFNFNLHRTTHFTLGYIFDILRRPPYRVGLGANIDYHSGNPELQPVYGHKPQSVFTFVRVRTDRATRPASP